MERVGTDAARILEAAAALARRHHHEMVEPEHVLRVLATDPLAAAVLTDLAIDGARLAELLDERLAAMQVSGLYRDGPTDPATSGELRLLLHHAGASRLVAFLSPVTIEQLAFATCGWPDLAPLVSSAHGESFTAGAMLARARMFAAQRGDERVNAFHVLHVVAAQAWMQSALCDARVDPVKLQGALERMLESALVKKVPLASGFAQLTNRGQWLGPLLRTPRIAALFSEDLGVSVHAVLRALVDSSATLVRDDGTLPSSTDEGRIDIVFHDDEFTTMQFVVDVLKDALAVSPADAVERMKYVHENGAAVVATLSSGDARIAVEKARSHARREQMPLRITWRPSGAVEVGSSDG